MEGTEILFRDNELRSYAISFMGHVQLTLKRSRVSWTLKNHEKRVEEYEELHNVAALQLKKVSWV